MLIPNIIIIRSIKHNLNYTKTITTVGMLGLVLGIMGTIIVAGYLHAIKAEAKTHSLSTSMSTSCNGETDEPCQTIVCKNDKPCRNSDSNSSSHPQQTENTTAAAQPKQQADRYSNDDEMTSFLQTPPIPQIPDYSDYGFD